MKVVPTRLSAKLVALSQVIASGDYAPTNGQSGVFDELSAQLDGHLKRLQDVIDTDVAGFIETLSELGLPAVVS
jgi:hypothetical protein